jgi:uncharacterized repeat protein (TIGR03803 family)
MKSRLKNVFLLPGLIVVFGSAAVGQGGTQTFMVLHEFAAMSTNSYGVYTNSDGAGPDATLILSHNTLYGTAHFAGSSGFGAVFAVNTDGTSFKNLHSFTASSGPNYTNTDGAYPFAKLLLSSNTLYGTTQGGGGWGFGAVFAVNTDGTDFRNLHSFTTSSPPNYTNSDGANPSAGLILSGNILYGTTSQGGVYGKGTLFAVNTDGTGFKNLHSFTATSGRYSTNSDGAGLTASLVLVSNTLYGTAGYGGSEGNGTVFCVNTDGTGFTNLHNFNEVGGGEVMFIQGFGALILSGNTLYGTKSVDGTKNVGPVNYGTVFRINTDGSAFATLYSFTNSRDEGSSPLGGLILSNNTLYGTTAGGGSGGYYGYSGTIFAINTDGTDFRSLYSFTDVSSGPNGTNSDGAYPDAGLIVSDNTLYGVASGGGSHGCGTIFSLTLPGPPRLTIILSRANIILTWPTNAAGFSLQYATNLGTATLWTTNSQAPVIVNGQNSVTNAISPKQQFFRLSQ